MFYNLYYILDIKYLEEDIFQKENKSCVIRSIEICLLFYWLRGVGLGYLFGGTYQKSLLTTTHCQSSSLCSGYL